MRATSRPRGSWDTARYCACAAAYSDCYMSEHSRAYTCDECHRTFDEGWSDDEAQAEALRTFGVRGDSPGMARVCDDCYRAIMARLRRARVRSAWASTSH